MSKKDRIAIVLSLLWFLGFIFAAMPRIKGDELMVAIIPLVIYWGFRFIKNDISFLGKKDG